MSLDDAAGPRMMRPAEAELVERYEARTTAAAMAADFPDFVVESASGLCLHAANGTRWLDLTAGLGSIALGHGAPAVLEAARRQLADAVHLPWQVISRPRAALLQRLATVVPHDDPGFVFTVTGSEAVEAALKVVRSASGRFGVFGFSGGYHGKTGGSLEVTANPALRKGLGPTRSSAVSLPYPTDEGLVAHLDPREVVTPATALHWIDLLLKQRDFARGEYGSVIIEPVQGSRMLAAPPGFLAGLADLLAAHDLLLICDEVFSGVGRTGRWFAVDAEGVRPDVLVLGKALGGGTPISVVAANRKLTDALPPYVQTSTFAAQPLACAIGCAVVDGVTDEVLAGVTARSEQFRGTIAALGAELASCGSDLRLAVTGRGLMLAVHFVLDDAAAGVTLANRVRRELFARGVFALSAGNIIKVTPPLVISATELDEVGAALRAAVLAGTG